MSSFEPNYWVLTFLIFRTFAFIEIVGVLALIRTFSAQGLSRLMALGSLVLALAGVLAKYAVPLTSEIGSALDRSASHFLHAGDGMALPIGVALVFLASSFSPGRRWWGLDLVFGLVCAAFGGLWLYTLL